jgi:hypothetical protein
MFAFLQVPLASAPTRIGAHLLVTLTALLILQPPAAAQTSGHVHDAHGDQPKVAPAPAATPAPDHAGMDHAAMGHDMGGMPHMPAMLGSYSMMREASGTAWQPESSPMFASMGQAGDWSLMTQGFANLVHSDQGGPRGDRKTFSESMFMLMGNRPVGAAGRIGLRAMLSLDPLMGKSGYPLLFATGETADGREPLIDRQHPHDFLMELAASYAHDLGDGRSVYLYAGLPGEPALGPPTFMHRLSGWDSPEAPITHHWFDSTHITFGVVTVGYGTRTWKVEASAFKGREPDQGRWDFETPKLDSWSLRAFWNPTANLSMQLSHGFLHSPEQLHPEDDERRTTASLSHNLPLGNGTNIASTIAWSLKDGHEHKLNGVLAETGLRIRDRHLLFGRAEFAEEAELFHHGAYEGEVFDVAKLSLGYAYELPLGTGPFRLAFGGLASAYAYPDRLAAVYGDKGVKSAMLFARIRLAGSMSDQRRMP